MAGKENELVVVTKAKDLCVYIMRITEKSPKRFRFTFTSRLQNLSLEIIENLYRANDLFVSREAVQAKKERLEFQQKALTAVKLLAYFSLLATEEGCILPKQYEQIAKRSADCQHLPGAWMKQDYKEGKTSSADIRRTLTSYYGHLFHGHTWHLRKNVMKSFVLCRESL